MISQVLATTTSNSVPMPTPSYLHLQNIRTEHFILPTWMLVGFLVVIFVILKTFIYMEDGKRKNR